MGVEAKKLSVIRHLDARTWFEFLGCTYSGFVGFIVVTVHAHNPESCVHGLAPKIFKLRLGTQGYKLI